MTHHVFEVLVSCNYDFCVWCFASRLLDTTKHQLAKKKTVHIFLEARLNKIFLEQRTRCHEIENCLCAVFIYIKADLLSEEDTFRVWFSTDDQINSTRLQTKE